MSHYGASAAVGPESEGEETPIVSFVLFVLFMYGVVPMVAGGPWYRCGPAALGAGESSVYVVYVRSDRLCGSSVRDNESKCDCYKYGP